MQIEAEKKEFNFEGFKNRAIADMKADKSLVGKDGVFTPLMKEFLEAALEEEMDSHMRLPALIRERLVQLYFFPEVVSFYAALAVHFYSALDKAT